VPQPAQEQALPSSSARRGAARSLCVLGALTLVVFLTAGSAQAARLPRTRLGVNVKVWGTGDQIQPTSLKLASHAGATLARTEADEGTDMDGVVQWLARSHMRLYPILGLPCPVGTASCTFQTEIPPATAAQEMASYTAAFAQRYGPHGSFWSQNPRLPYLPVERFEIGNESNIRTIWVQDDTHLHWQDPSNPNLADFAAYAKVYEAARTALHSVDPRGVAVVGGLADSASFGADIQNDELLLSALPRGKVDAVGYHPWVFTVSNKLLKPDTTDLRTWLDRHGFSKATLDINELGACGNAAGKTSGQTCRPAQTSAGWGATAGSYARWDLCSPWLKVDNVQAFVYGGTPTSDGDIWLPLVSSTGNLTAYGNRFFAQSKRLTTHGCRRRSGPLRTVSPHNLHAPSITGVAAAGVRLRAHPGRWSRRPKRTLYYQWLRCNPHGRACSSIGHAIAPTYTAHANDVGSTLAILVTAIGRAGGATASSRVTAQVLPTRPRGKGGAGRSGR
jgi:hypothetical protein